MSNVINIDDYRPSKPSSEEEILIRFIDIQQELIELNRALMLNYDEHKSLLKRLNESLNNEGDENE
jgi:hypothetical protein